MSEVSLSSQSHTNKLSKFLDSCSINPNLEEQPVWKYFWFVLGFGFLLRAIIALSGDFVLHPDEIMQHYEPAHQAVFGNGVSYWEFFYGARNWIVPGIIATLLWFLNLIGLGEPWFYIDFLKLFFCAFSLLIPWGIYTFSRNQVGENVARVVLIVMSLWPFLIVYAHKPFTEFVSANLICACLGLATTKHAKRAGVVGLVSVLLALATLIRFQYASVTFLIWLCIIYKQPKRHILNAIGGVLCAVILVGLLETFTWGRPFHSYYLNFMYNYARRDNLADLSNFYLPRLMMQSAGLILLAAIACIHKPFRYSQLVVILVLTIGLHILAVHKEIRFLLIVLPICLYIAIDWLIYIANRKTEQQKIKFVSTWLYVYIAIFSIFVYTDSVPKFKHKWLHHAEVESSGVYFLAGHNGMWEIYRDLATNDSVKGVLHLGDPYFNTPGYYYLHKKVPFYDATYLDLMQEKYGVEQLNLLVSHVVSKSHINIAGFRFVGINDYYLYESTRLDEPVATWDRYQIVIIGAIGDAVREFVTNFSYPKYIDLDTSKITQAN